MKIIVRGDSGFCRDDLMTWIEGQAGVHYVFGLARNARLQSLLAPEFENFYCARGDMENRIKQQQLDLFADRTSTAPFAVNQLRLWVWTFAYLLVARLRATSLQGTVLARATVGAIRLRLLKVAAMVTVSVRRVHIRLAGAFPLKEAFRLARQQLAT